MSFSQLVGQSHSYLDRYWAYATTGGGTYAFAVSPEQVQGWIGLAIAVSAAVAKLISWYRGSRKAGKGGLDIAGDVADAVNDYLDGKVGPCELPQCPRKAPSAAPYDPKRVTEAGK